MPDENTVIVPEFAEANLLIQGIVTESFFGSGSGDPRLAASSRQTYAIACILALILAGIGEEKFNSLATGGTLDAVADNSDLVKRISDLEQVMTAVGNNQPLSPDVLGADSGVADAITAIRARSAPAG